MKNVFALVAIALVTLFSGNAFAQLERPAPSPAASVSQVVGFTKITIDYSSPAVKGRKVFGELEKYGVTWRAGANGPTKVTFSTPVTIGGKRINAGSYSLFITPVENGEWTVHFNGKGNSVYNYMKDDKVDEAALAADDATSIKVKPTISTTSTERLMYSISAGNNKLATITMAWDKVVLSFTVDTMADQTLEGFKGAF
jgi:Protein of unknown function (DUF2911)